MERIRKLLYKIKIRSYERSLKCLKEEVASMEQYKREIENKLDKLYFKYYKVY